MGIDECIAETNIVCPDCGIIITMCKKCGVEFKDGDTIWCDYNFTDSKKCKHFCSNCGKIEQGIEVPESDHTAEEEANLSGP